MLTLIKNIDDNIVEDISSYIKDGIDLIVEGNIKNRLNNGFKSQWCICGIDETSQLNDVSLPILMNHRQDSIFHKIVYITTNINFKDILNYFDQVIYITNDIDYSHDTIKKKYYKKRKDYNFLIYQNDQYSDNSTRENKLYKVEPGTTYNDLGKYFKPEYRYIPVDRPLEITDMNDLDLKVLPDSQISREPGVIIFKANDILTKNRAVILDVKNDDGKIRDNCRFAVDNNDSYNWYDLSNEMYSTFRSGRYDGGKDLIDNRHRVIYTMDLNFKDYLGIFDKIIYVSDKDVPANSYPDTNPNKESYYKVDYNQPFYIKDFNRNDTSVFHNYGYTVDVNKLYTRIYKLPYTTQSLLLINYSDNKSQPWIFRETHYINDPDIENIYSRNENSFIEVQHKGLIGAFDHLYRKISYLDTTKTYKLSFKYKINLVDKQGHTVTDSNYPSYLTLLPDSHNFKYYGYFNGFYKSTELKMNTTDYQTFTAEFTPTSSVIYPSFEFGALRGYGYIDIKISEFKIEEEHKIQRQISIPNDQVWFTNYSEGFSYKNGISESGSYGVDITQYINSKNWEKNYTILDLKPRTEYKISFIAKYDYKGGHAYFNVYGESAAKSKMLGEFNQNYGGDNITASEFGGIELNRNDSQQKTLKFTTKDEGKIYLFFSYANLDDYNTLKFSVQNLQITELTNDPSYGEVKLNENIKQTDNLIIYRNHIVNSLFRRTKQLY